VQRIGDNPAYAVVATAVGLLVYLYLFNQVLLWGAALASTDIHGDVVDLAADPTLQQQEDTFQQRLAEENRGSDDPGDTAP
jgi:membrane protein